MDVDRPSLVLHGYAWMTCGCPRIIHAYALTADYILKNECQWVLDEYQWLSMDAPYVTNSQIYFTSLNSPHFTSPQISLDGLYPLGARQEEALRRQAEEEDQGSKCE